LRSPAHRFELVHPGITHFGTAVHRGQDGAGRVLISLVVLFAKRVDRAQLDELRTELTGRINLARHQEGLPTLSSHPGLVEVCTEQAAAMARSGELDERILGDLVTEQALERTDLGEARVQLAAVDDPRRLQMARVALAPTMRHVGIG